MVANWFKTFFRVLRHRSLDTTDTRRAIPADMVQRLMERVAASEQRHTGEIRIYVESSLPSSYLWRGAGVRNAPGLQSRHPWPHRRCCCLP